MIGVRALFLIQIEKERRERLMSGRGWESGIKKCQLKNQIKVMYFHDRVATLKVEDLR